MKAWPFVAVIGVIFVAWAVWTVGLLLYDDGEPFSCDMGQVVTLDEAGALTCKDLPLDSLTFESSVQGECLDWDTAEWGRCYPDVPADLDESGGCADTFVGNGRTGISVTFEDWDWITCPEGQRPTEVVFMWNVDLYACVQSEQRGWSLDAMGATTTPDRVLSGVLTCEWRGVE